MIEFDRAVRRKQDRAAGRLVHAARLHADEAVFDQIETADPIVVAELVEGGEQGRGAHRLAVDRDRIAFLERDLDHGRLVGRVLGMNGARVDISRRFFRRVLQNLALGGDVQEVRVGRKRRFAALVLGDRDLMLLGEGNERIAGGELPFAPRRDDLDVGLERVSRQFEAHLIVALAGRAMSDRVSAHFAGDLDQVLGDQRPRNRGAKEVQALVLGVGAEHREDVVAHEFLAHVLDEDVLGLDAQQFRLLARRLKLLALAEVGGEGDDLGAIFSLQPFEDDGRVEPARIGEDDALDLRLLAARHG